MTARVRSSDDRLRRGTLEARYTNYFEVGHNAAEFIFDFGQYHRENYAVKLHSRVVTGPVYAKLLADMLSDAVQRFEEEHGAIETSGEELDPLGVRKHPSHRGSIRSSKPKKKAQGSSQ